MIYLGYTLANINYNKYKNNEQDEISTTGSIIENVYIDEDITDNEIIDVIKILNDTYDDFYL